MVLERTASGGFVVQSWNVHPPSSSPFGKGKGKQGKQQFKLRSIPDRTVNRIEVDDGEALEEIYTSSYTLIFPSTNGRVLLSLRALPGRRKSSAQIAKYKICCACSPSAVTDG